MRRLFAFWMAVALVAANPLSLAATDPPSVKERIAAIRENYGMEVTCQPSIKKQVPAYLDDLEAALEILGPNFIRQVVNYFVQENSPFRVEIVPFPAEQMEDYVDAIFRYSDKPGYEQVIQLYVKEEKGLKPATIVHEFGHVLQRCTGYDGFAAINGGVHSYLGEIGDEENFKPNRYVSIYAMIDDMEDFAETFTYMVMKNRRAEEHLRTLKPTSRLYKKYHYIYDCLVRFAGSGSRATKRAAAFLIGN